MSDPVQDFPFIDPYEGLSKVDLNNTTIEVSRKDHGFLYSLFPHRSVLQTTINILLSRFIAECKANGITDYNPHRYRKAIANTTIFIRDGGAVAVAISQSDTDQPKQADSRDDGRRAGEVGDVNKGLPAATPDDAGGVPRGGKQKKADKAKRAGN
jgi:hypothetical protein